MAAISGLWKANAGSQITALQQGTGANPIFGQRGGPGRNIVPDPSVNPMSPALLDEYAPEDYGYSDEDHTSTLWGYGTETGTSDRPPLDNVDGSRRGTAKFPSWGQRGGIPGGTAIRAENHGADAGFTSKNDFEESAVGGWRNKENTYVSDAVTSDPSQYEIQTSMVQRDKTREGSQSNGTASEYSAPIRSRIPGMRARYFGSPTRHADMEPKSQDMIIRPYWLRQAGTGPREYLAANDAYESIPRERVAPANPDVGEPVSGEYGFTSEDAVY